METKVTFKVDGEEYIKVKQLDFELKASCKGCVLEYENPTRCDDFPACFGGTKDRGYFIFKKVKKS